MEDQQKELLVPNEVLKRDLNVGTATAGGNLVSNRASKQVHSSTFLE